MAENTGRKKRSLEALNRRVRELALRPTLTASENLELSDIELELRYFSTRPSARVESTPVSQAEVPSFDMPPSPYRTRTKSAKTKKGKRLNTYQQHIKECRLGSGEFDGQGRKGFNECVDMWREIKRRKGLKG